MDKETLRKVQLVQLEIANEIARVCKLCGIKYFLVGGTLLGAVRHKGFIPWDDDLDIGMFRKDYEKFLEIAPNYLDVKYKIIDWKSDNNYPFPMGKVIKRGTVYKERKRKDLGEQGIWVDVFPYDNIESTHILAERGFKLKVLWSLIRSKNKYQTWVTQDGISLRKYVKNLPIRFLSFFMNREKLIAKYEVLSKKDNDIETKYVFENGAGDYTEWCFKRDYFQKLKEINFEDSCFLCAEEYDKYLSDAYGNYMQLPPENERDNRHLIDEIDFGG